jgi:hypothetical protein
MQFGAPGKNADTITKIVFTPPYVFLSIEMPGLFDGWGLPADEKLILQEA